MKNLFLLVFSSCILFSCSTKLTNFVKNGPEDITYELSPDSIFAGESATLTWDVQNLKKGVDVNISGLGKVAPKGSQTVSPSKTTRYSLRLSKKNKSLPSKGLILEVKPKPVPAITSFSIYPKAITAGEVANLSWQIKDLDGNRIEIEGVGNVFGSNGKKSVKPTENTTYTIKVYQNGKVASTQTAKIIVEPYVEPIPPVGFSTGPDDGRFTLGGNGKRLMYGWPVPRSTSHFIVKVDDNFATNFKILKSDKMYYISGEEKVKGQLGSVYTEISYYLDGVKVTQRLIPVDKNFKKVSINTFGQYYKIEYEVENTTDTAKEVGVLTLVDFMLDNNDASQSEIEGELIENESEYAGDDIPDELIVYKEFGNKEEHAGKVVFNQGAVEPDFIYIGRWPYFYRVIWDVEVNEQKYGDSGILLKWDEKPLVKGEKRKASFYYGLLQEGKITSVSAKSELKESSVTVYFDMGRSRLNKAARDTIQAVMEGIEGTIVGMEISGYADAVGEEDFNDRLSGRRIKSVMNYLAGKKMDRTTMIPKQYGETSALQSEEAMKKGNDPDRRCEVIFFYN